MWVAEDSTQDDVLLAVVQRVTELLKASNG
jgi:hypothetical protein